jgi:hypothetical protein
MLNRHNASSLSTVKIPPMNTQIMVKQAVKDKKRIAEIRKELSTLKKELSVVLGLAEPNA